MRPVVLGALLTLLAAAEDCEISRMKCAYRVTCGQALHSYMVDCADVLAGRTARCPWSCKRALISLTSSEEGVALSTCDCGDSEFCSLSKERAEVCRPEVAHATAEDTIVSCSVAQWICAADPQCSIALEYYHRLCRAMFHGRKCTPRCNNSLAILDRQDKASKLRTCFCDGSEDFPCHRIRENTQRLCFGREDQPSVRPGQSSGATGKGLAVMLVGFMACLWANGLAALLEDSWSPRSSWNKQLPRSCRRTFGTSDRKRNRRLTLKNTWPWWWTSEHEK